MRVLTWDVWKEPRAICFLYTHPSYDVPMHRHSSSFVRYRRRIKKNVLLTVPKLLYTPPGAGDTH